MKTADNGRALVAQHRHDIAGLEQGAIRAFDGAKYADLAPREKLLISNRPKLRGSGRRQSVDEMARPIILRWSQCRDFESFHGRRPGSRPHRLCLQRFLQRQDLIRRSAMSLLRRDED